MLRTLLAALLLLLAAPSQARAQAVIGEVVEEGTGRPIALALVRLIDADGGERARALTDTAGLFVFRSVVPATYTLAAEQIGYADVAGEPVTVVRGESVRVTLVLRVRALALAEVRAEARSQCRVRPESSADTQRLWEEAKKALGGTASALKPGNLRFEMTTYRQALDVYGRPQRQAQRDTAWGVWARPFETLPPAELARKGFIQERDANTFIYYAPGADALLSDEFLSAHCFWVQRPSASRHEGMIGLAFEPLRGHRVSDISGVLWLDTATSELRRLEFAYTRLPWGLADGQASGHASYRRTAAGTWVIEDWSIRVPRVRAGSSVRRGQYEVTGFDEGGGHVRSVRAPEVPATTSRVASVLGIVFDSTRMAPLADARVVFEGTSLETRTDAQGRYHFTEAPTGVHQLRVLHPRLDSLEATLAHTITVRVGRILRVNFAIPRSAPPAPPSAHTAAPPLPPRRETLPSRALLPPHRRTAPDRPAAR